MTDDASAVATDADILVRGEAELQLLLEEYRTVRAEVLQRIGSRAQLLGLLGASAALVIGLSDHQSVEAYLLGAVVVVVLTSYWWRGALLLRRAAQHVVAIEERINLVAKSTYGIQD